MKHRACSRLPRPAHRRYLHIAYRIISRHLMVVKYHFEKRHLIFHLVDLTIPSDCGILLCTVDTTYISEGNDKTNCYSFDLPPKATCPGKTVFCASRCYAVRLSKLYPAAGDKYERNLEFTNSDAFVSYMIHNIPRNCEFRIHVSGDFHCTDYVKKWGMIVSARKDVTFYTYTRSWRVGDIWKYLRLLSMFPNVNINLSLDIETGMPTFNGAESYRWCYLSNDDTAPSWLRRNDIIFRTNHNLRKGNHQWLRQKAINDGKDPNQVAPLLHRIGNGVVCPFERGKSMPAFFSCSQCRLCIKKPQEKVTACT